MLEFGGFGTWEGVGEFRVYRASIRLPQGVKASDKAPITVTTHLKMS